MLLRSAPAANSAVESASLSDRAIAQQLSAIQQQLEGDDYRSVSVARSLPDVDPLDMLAAGSDARMAYWQSGATGECLAAGGALEHYETAGPNRFAAVKAFVQTRGPISLGAAPPRFLTYFSFFDRVSDDYPFAAATVTLPEWMVIRERERCIGMVNVRLERSTDLDETLAQLERHFGQLMRGPIPPSSTAVAESRSYRSVVDASAFRASVTQVLEAISAHRLHKVVLAQAIDAIATVPLQPFEVLRRLRQAHPDCYVFAVKQGSQTFLGASPECLVRRQGQLAIADALAGSAPRGDTATRDDLLARQLLDSAKDRREHDTVVKAIACRLRGLGLVPDMALAPTLMQLPTIQHLYTPISTRVPEALHLLDLAAALHPTPAVSGAPAAAAGQYIQACEPFERGLYAAPLGWVDRSGNGEMAVAIRSAWLSDRRARLYAGAGIVSGSDPHKELQEIHLKLQALVAALA